jgi:glycerol-3-phosphate responsive antiterminator
MRARIRMAMGVTCSLFHESEPDIFEFLPGFVNVILHRIIAEVQPVCNLLISISFNV